MIESDEKYMERALDLALRGRGLVSPNPMVGAVLVQDGRIVGEGYHRYDYLRHAESFALEQAGEASYRATLYCNLEPCSHYGRTPPCTDTLIAAGVAQVIAAIQDPDPRVSGRGFERLRSAGIQVEVGLGRQRASRLNESYLKYATHGLPFVHVLVACSRIKLVTAEENGGSRSLEGETADPWWEPSAELSQSLCNYDAFVLGDAVMPPIRFLRDCLQRIRHRPAFILGSRAAISAARSVAKGKVGDGSAAALAELELNPTAIELQSDGLFDPQKQLREMSRMGVSSLVFLPGSLPLLEIQALEFADKVTLLEQSNIVGGTGQIGPRLQLLEERITRSGEVLEITGYPDRG